MPYPRRRATACYELLALSTFVIRSVNIGIEFRSWWVKLFAAKKERKKERKTVRERHDLSDGCDVREDWYWREQGVHWTLIYFLHFSVTWLLQMRCIRALSNRWGLIFCGTLSSIWFVVTKVESLFQPYLHVASSSVLCVIVCAVTCFSRAIQCRRLQPLSTWPWMTKYFCIER